MEMKKKNIIPSPFTKAKLVLILKLFNKSFSFDIKRIKLYDLVIVQLDFNKFIQKHDSMHCL